jgi:hypothetical protein
MAEVIREREIHEVHNEGSGAGWAVAAVVVIALVLFLIFGLPALRNVDTGGTNVNIPDQIDVNVGGGGN